MDQLGAIYFQTISQWIHSWPKHPIHFQSLTQKELHQQQLKASYTAGQHRVWKIKGNMLLDQVWIQQQLNTYLNIGSKERAALMCTRDNKQLTTVSLLWRSSGSDCTTGRSCWYTSLKSAALFSSCINIQILGSEVLFHFSQITSTSID